MKKFSVILLSCILALTVFVSCSENNVKDTDNKNNEQEKIIEIDSFDTLMKESQAVSSEIESIKYDMDIDVDIDAMGEKLDAVIHALVETTGFATLTHTKMNIVAMDEDISIEAYSDAENAVTYTCNSGEWCKEALSKDSISQLRNYLNMSNELKLDYSKYYTDTSFEITDFDGQKCYKSKYTMDLKLIEMLEDADMMETFNSAMQENGIDEFTSALIKALFEDLGTTTVISYFDAKTLYPVHFNIDMTDIINTLVNKVSGMVSMMSGGETSAEEISSMIKVNSVVAKINATGINNVTITIPDEALSAPELPDESIGIIGEADEPTEIIVGDEYSSDETDIYYDSFDEAEADFEESL